MKKIVIVYHAYMYGDWYRKMMFDQFHSIIHTGLFAVCNKLYIGLVDTPDKKPKDGLEWAKKFWSFPSSKENHAPSKVEIVVYPENKEETSTLAWLRDFAKDNPDYYVLYFHTKSMNKYTPFTEDWRKYMEYFVLENWKDCVQKLDEGYDCCGVMWNSDTPIGYHPHFSGNFWWATSEYINTLDNHFLETDWRYDREFWIGTNPNAKAFEFHNSHLNDKSYLVRARGHYDMPYTRNNYEKKEGMQLHVICTVFQRVKPLGRLIYDFLCQTNPNWTLHIVHDGPTPKEITDLVNSFGDSRISLESTPTVNGKWGFPNRKMMIEQISGRPTDYLLITNDDNEHCQASVECFLGQAGEGVGMVYSDTLHSYQGYTVLQTRMQVCYIDMSSFITRMDIAKKIGMNHEHEQADGIFAEECALECSVRGLKIVKINKVLNVHN